MNRLQTYQILSVKHMMKRVFAFIVASFLLGSIHAQCTLACHDSLTVSLNSTGFHIVDLGEIIAGSTLGCTDVIVKLYDEDGVYFGDTITCAYVGQSIEAQALDTTTNNYCTTTISVMDYQPPVIDCQDIFIFCNDPTTPSFTGYPSVSDNCTYLDSTNLSYSDTQIDLDCFTTQAGETVTAKIERVWTVMDASGNQDVCTQNIYLKRVTLGNVVFPQHHDGFALPVLVCSVDDPLDFSVAGEPTIFGKPIDNSGFCEIVVTYSDQTFPSCGGGTRILRNWQVFDFCANTNQQQIQVIKVEDKTPPVITCPNDITLGLDPYDCSTTVTLVQPTATDECSTVTLSANWQFGSGFGPFPNIPPGNYPVTYIATDACGNSSTCSITVTLEDDIPPSPVCQNSLSVSLLNTGNVRLYATSMDGGSSDNCQIVSTLASRDNSSFGDYVTFTCADIDNSPILVTFKVIDAAGLSNTCQLYVSVSDYIKPTVVCPPDLTLNCQTDIYNLNITSQAAATDNCGIDTIYYQDDITNITCGNELITRKWVIVDIHGNKDSCEQHIQLEDNAVLSIQFPSDISIDICQTNSDPENTGKPILAGVGCKEVLMSHQDNYFFSTTSCTVIQRVWEVTDWCEYVPNSGSNAGKYLGTQLITLEDNTAPVFSCNDTIVYDNLNACSNVYVNLPDVLVSDCDSELTIINTSPYATNSGNNASGSYPHGVHDITYVAEDGCGNQSSCTFTLTVKDNVAPTVFCKTNLSFHLNAGGSLTLTPDQVDNGSTDNCTNSVDLIKVLVPNQFDCSDIGINTVQLIVTDASGNSSVCESGIEILDDNICSGKIYGVINNAWGSPVVDASVIIHSDMHIYEATTDTNGYYEVTAEIGETYSVTPIKTMNSNNGISTSDVIIMAAHILGVQVLTDPYLLAAADVDESGRINVKDIIQLRKVLLRLSVNFSKSDSWKFVQSAYDFGSGFNKNYPRSYTISNFSGSPISYDFIGMKTGDLNKNAKGNRNKPRDLIMKIENKLLKVGENYQIPIFISDLDENEDFEGLQLTFKFGEYSISNVKILNNEGLDMPQYYNYTDDILRLSWNKNEIELLNPDDPIFYISFKSQTTDFLSRILTLSNRYLQPESYFLSHHELEVGALNLSWVQKESVEKSDLVQEEWTVYPNPFSDFTDISLNLKQKSLIRFEFYNLSGSIIFQDKRKAEKGINTFRFHRSSFGGTNGLVLCKVYNDDSCIYQNIKLLLIN